VIQIGKVIFSIIAVIGILYFGLFVTSKTLNSEAEDAINKIETEVYKNKNADIPSIIKSLRNNRDDIFYLVSPLRVNYSQRERSILYYSQFPLGPKHVYNLTNKTWGYEE
jgi:uncharacterized membrane protein YvbJ